MWIVGRIGILVCFGILPMMHACQRVRLAPAHDSFAKSFAAFAEMNKYPVSSPAWNSNFAVAKYWSSNGSAQVNKILEGHRIK